MNEPWTDQPTPLVNATLRPYVSENGPSCQEFAKLAHTSRLLERRMRHAEAVANLLADVIDQYLPEVCEQSHTMKIYRAHLAAAKEMDGAK